MWWFWAFKKANLKTKRSHRNQAPCRAPWVDFFFFCPHFHRQALPNWPRRQGCYQSAQNVWSEIGCADIFVCVCVVRWKLERLTKPRWGAQQTGSGHRRGAIEQHFFYLTGSLWKLLTGRWGWSCLRCVTPQPEGPEFHPLAAEFNLIRPGIFSSRCSEKGFLHLSGWI